MVIPTARTRPSRDATRAPVGAAPRGPGEQRADLIRKNGPIFVGQGQAIAKNAAADVRILVVGNPCNTNCLIANRNGKDVPAEQWHAMTRLDHNRAVSALAAKAGVGNDAITCMTIWGNHSNTQYPDFTNAKVNGKPATSVLTDRAWTERTFVRSARRGKFIIDTTKVLSECSYAAARSTISSLVNGTASGDWTSAHCLKGSTAERVRYPCTTSGNRNWKVVEGLKLDAFGQASSRPR